MAELKSVISLLQRWASSHDSQLETDVLSLVRQRREFDILFTAALDVLRDVTDVEWCYVTSAVVLDALRDEFFTTLSPLTAHQLAEQLIKALRVALADANGSAFASVAALTYRLLCAVPLLSANRLREWVHTDLIDVFTEAVSEAESGRLNAAGSVGLELFHGGAALLVAGVYVTLAVELYYGAAQPADQWPVWRRLGDSPGADRVASVIHASTLLLGAAADDRKRAAKGARRLARSVDTTALYMSVPKHLRHLVYGDVSFHFLLWNLPALAAAAPKADDVHGVVGRLVTYASAVDRLPALFASVEQAANLRYSVRGTALQTFLVDCLRTAANIRFRNDTATECEISSASVNGSQTPTPVYGNGSIA